MAESSKKEKVVVGLDEFKSRIKKADLNTFFIFGAIILVLGIGIFAAFSSTAQNLRRGNPACGKIVVAADGPSLKANVSPTLSEAKYFLVINPLSKKLLEAAKNPYMGMQTPGLDVAYFIAGKGEEAVIAGSINPRYYDVLTQFGIRSFGGYNGRVKNAVSLYRQARISQTVSTSPMDGKGSSMAGTQVAFGFGERAFICPACNWRLKGHQQGDTYPGCPNCGALMAKDMSNPGWQWWRERNSLRTATNMVPMQNNANWAQSQPNFWQGPDSTGFFICPSCNWRMYAQKDIGQFPRCPNCRNIMARGGAASQNRQVRTVADMVPMQNNINWAPQPQQPNFWQGPDSTGFFVCPNCNWRMYAQKDIGQFPRCPNCRNIMARGGAASQNRQSPGLNAQAPGSANQVPAPPIYSNATMPHSYRGICSNCHQILQGSQYGAYPQGTGAAQTGWNRVYNRGGVCILR